jgi:hypothetical protein
MEELTSVEVVLLYMLLLLYSVWVCSSINFQVLKGISSLPHPLLLSVVSQSRSLSSLFLLLIFGGFFFASSSSSSSSLSSISTSVDCLRCAVFFFVWDITRFPHTHKHNKTKHQRNTTKTRAQHNGGNPKWQTYIAYIWLHVGGRFSEARRGYSSQIIRTKRKNCHRCMCFTTPFGTYT